MTANSVLVPTGHQRLVAFGGLLARGTTPR